MHLSDSEMKNREQWEKAGIRLPGFDREAMRQGMPPMDTFRRGQYLPRISGSASAGAFKPGRGENRDYRGRGL